MRGWMERAGRLMLLTYSRNEGTFVAREERHPAVPDHEASRIPAAVEVARTKPGRATANRRTK